MTKLAWDISGDGLFRTAGPFGEKAAVSPSGERVVYILPRTRPVDLVERERVRVASIESGEELATVPGPATARTLYWVREDRLLIARDVRGGMRLTLVEVPPGEVIAEVFLSGAAEQRYDVTQTPDGRTLCASESRTIFEGEGRAWILDAETLVVRREIRDVRPASDVRLHPDGDRLLYAECVTPYGHVRSSVRAFRVRVDPPRGPPWEVMRSASDLFTARWSGPEMALALVHSRGGSGRSNATPPTEAFARVEWHQIDVAQGVPMRSGEIAEGPFEAVDASEDGARVASLRLLYRNATRKRGLTAELTVHDVAHGAAPLHHVAALPDHAFTPENFQRAALAWTHDERVVGVIPGARKRTVVVTQPDGTLRTQELPHESYGGWYRSVSVRGRWLVEQLWDEHRLRLVDVGALR